MQRQSFERFICWQHERISQVINKEAASVSRATFLATHTPIRQLFYEQAPYAINDVSENGLLQELERCNNEDRHVFAVIQGIPGTGKSHLIRWLKERYEADEGQQAKVLFIERAQCTLRGTLDQLIQQDIFDDERLLKQLDRLRGATTVLSSSGLAENLLDQLRLATQEEQQPTMAKWIARRREDLRMFLLDDTVRKELKKPNGPIDRLVHFLSQSSSRDRHGDEMPGFEANDFAFKAATLYEIKGGYAAAQDFTERLQGEDGEEKREELARYLNQLIQFAVGHATSLTSNDLKQLFYEVRRSLRQKGLHLALFIEDITAFTGIDTGLIDVLATQHTGEANSEYCRLISVIGITDNYFNDHFPNNLKERVTHRITLNARQHNTSEAGILTDAAATADMSARYLNAIRLDQRVLENWLQHGARPEQLPNACDQCTFATTCHASFGVREVAVNGQHTQRMGLYPFNEHALWTFYQHLNTTYNKRTPRSLLNIVLASFMQSYGSQIAYGLFPPIPSELGSNFTTFSLAIPLQRTMLEQQSGTSARRVETLILLWGNGTIDTNGIGEKRTVSGLTQTVFHAFNLPFIAGAAEQTHADVVTAPPSTNYPQPIPEHTSTVSPTQIPNIPETQSSKYTDAISDWLNGGKLLYYEEFAEQLLPFIRSAIDWEFHGVSRLLVDELLKGRRRIAFEDQVGKVNSAYYLTFARSSEMAAVLEGLMEIKERQQSLSGAVLSGHLANMSAWLRSQEAIIVQFVRQPNHESSHIQPLTQIVTLNCLLIACLQGKLQSTSSSAQALFIDIISVCQNMTVAEWQKSVDAARTTHSQHWYGLMTRIKNSVENQCKLLPRLLNCAQGDSSEVRFVDAAKALAIISDFKNSDWMLPSIELSGTTSMQYWDESIKIYDILRSTFPVVLQEERQHLQEILVQFTTYMDGTQAKDVLKAINTFSSVMSQFKRGTTFVQKTKLSVTSLNKTLEVLKSIRNEQSTVRFVLCVGGAGAIIETANEYLEYFKSFVTEANKQQEASTKRLVQLESQLNDVLSQVPEQVRSLYREIERQLACGEEE